MSNCPVRQIYYVFRVAVKEHIPFSKIVQESSSERTVLVPPKLGWGVRTQKSLSKGEEEVEEVCKGGKLWQRWWKCFQKANSKQHPCFPVTWQMFHIQVNSSRFLTTPCPGCTGNLGNFSKGIQKRLLSSILFYFHCNLCARVKIQCKFVHEWCLLGFVCTSTAAELVSCKGQGSCIGGARVCLSCKELSMDMGVN